jgi:hypothetical protein
VAARGPIHKAIDPANQRGKGLLEQEAAGSMLHDEGMHYEGYYFKLLKNSITI